MEKITEDEILQPKDLEEWQAMLVKVRKGNFFSDEEELIWFRRLAILEQMKVEDFIASREYTHLYTVYMSVSSTLRHMRRQKKADEESSGLVKLGLDEDDDSDSPVWEAGAFLTGEVAWGASPCFRL